MTVPALEFPRRCNQQLLFLGILPLSMLKVLLLRDPISLELKLMKSNPTNLSILPVLRTPVITHAWRMLKTVET
jgi:hypothetical protein